MLILQHAKWSDKIASVCYNKLEVRINIKDWLSDTGSLMQSCFKLKFITLCFRDKHATFI